MNLHYNLHTDLETQVKKARSMLQKNGSCSGVGCSECPLNIYGGPTQCAEYGRKKSNDSPPALISYLQAFVAFHEGA